jgi:DNA end-binding protein Ku
VKTIWKGAISFGLVTIPVRVYGATEAKSLRFNQLHEPDGGRIRYKRVCSVDGEEVDYSEIVKGYEYEKDHYVTLTDEELDSLPVTTAKAIEIERFVEADEIDPIYFQKAYYLVPEGTGVKAYHLLREAMADDGKVALAKVAFRDKEHLATLRLRDNVFVLETMFWPDEIRVPKFDVLDESVELRPQEIRMARSLIDSLTDAFQPEEFTDEYRAALEELVQKKIQGEEITYTEEAEPSKVVDLMERSRRASRRPRPASRRRSPRRAAGGVRRRQASSRVAGVPVGASWGVDVGLDLCPSTAFRDGGRIDG